MEGGHHGHVPWIDIYDTLVARFSGQLREGGRRQIRQRVLRSRRSQGTSSLRCPVPRPRCSDLGYTRLHTAVTAQWHTDTQLRITTPRVPRATCTRNVRPLSYRREHSHTGLRMQCNMCTHSHVHPTFQKAEWHNGRRMESPAEQGTHAFSGQVHYDEEYDPEAVHVLWAGTITRVRTPARGRVVLLCTVRQTPHGSPRGWQWRMMVLCTVRQCRVTGGWRCAQYGRAGQRVHMAHFCFVWRAVSSFKLRCF